MKTITKGSLEVRGTKGIWEGAQSACAACENRTALMSCPECGKICSLSQHIIQPDGTVTPSVVCPREGCTFHDYVKLEGWK